MRVLDIQWIGHHASKPPMLGTSWKCCLCIYQHHQRGGRVGDGVFVWEREWGWGGLLSEAHNLIIQSIEQHIHFIVLQISPNSLGSSESPQNRTELQMRSPEGSAKSAVIAFFFNALHCQVCWNDFFSEHHSSLAFQYDMKMTQTRGGDVLLRCFEQCDPPQGRSAQRWHVIVRDT